MPWILVCTCAGRWLPAPSRTRSRNDGPFRVRHRRRVARRWRAGLSKHRGSGVRSASATVGESTTDHLLVVDVGGRAVVALVYDNWGWDDRVPV